MEQASKSFQILHWGSAQPIATENATWLLHRHGQASGLERITWHAKCTALKVVAATSLTKEKHDWS